MARDTVLPVRLTPSLRKRLEELMKYNNIEGLGAGIRVAVNLGCSAHELLRTGDIYAKGPEDPKIRSAIDNMTPDERDKFVVALINRLGVQYVNRLRGLHPESSGPQIVDKDTEEV